MRKVLIFFIGIVIAFFLIFILIVQDSFSRSMCLDSEGKSAIDLNNFCEISIVESVENFFKTRINLVNEDIDTIHIVISPKGIYLLETDRKNAMNNKILLSPISVNGDIYINNKRIEAKIRLKGELPDHWSMMRRASLNIELENLN